MPNENAARRYSATDAASRRAQGESRSDLDHVAAKTEAELARDIAADADFRDIPEDWAETAEPVIPTPTRRVALRIDDDVLEWFRRQGPGYQARMIAVLRDHARHAAGEMDTQARPGRCPGPAGA